MALRYEGWLRSSFPSLSLTAKAEGAATRISQDQNNARCLGMHFYKLLVVFLVVGVSGQDEVQVR